MRNRDTKISFAYESSCSKDFVKNAFSLGIISPAHKILMHLEQCPAACQKQSSLIGIKIVGSLKLKSFTVFLHKCTSRWHTDLQLCKLIDSSSPVLISLIQMLSHLPITWLLRQQSIYRAKRHYVRRLLITFYQALSRLWMTCSLLFCFFGFSLY